MFEKEVKAFCNLLNVKDLEELRPFVFPDMLSYMTKNELKFMSVTLMKAIQKLNLKSKSQKLFIINAQKFQLSYLNKKSPFFDSGYHGIKLNNLKATKSFYFMVTDGHVGLEDMSCASATIDDKNISLVYSDRSFGDCRMHAEDEEINVNKVANIIYEKFLEV